MGLKEKLFNEFNNCLTGRFGLHNHCRECQREVKRNWYLKNREKELLKSREFSKTDKAKIKNKIRYEKHKDSILEKNRVRRRTQHARQLANKARKKRYDENISFKMSVNIRSRIRIALKGITKFKRSSELLGCSVDFLKNHLESLFLDGMTWENYGYHGWHIDHILPCASFDLSDELQLKKCFHWTNLQPLWKFDNLSKGSKI